MTGKKNFITISLPGWKDIVIIFTLLAIAHSALAQDYTIFGMVKDNEDRSPLIGAHVTLVSAQDSTDRYFAVSDEAGRFEFAITISGSYVLETRYLGYLDSDLKVKINTSARDLGIIYLIPETRLLEEVQVKSRTPPVIQKGDTVQYNAQAYKTHPDASAQDLIVKMPGIVIENGTVKAQGEDVQKVLVDGKVFFGDDPAIALNNLPAEVIDKIEVFDKLSDQAQFTGFDNGQSIKTINIVTKTEMRNGQFGKAYGGLGTDDRYMSGGNLNMFNGDKRISILGLANNVNQQNFAAADLLEVIGSSSQRRMGGGGRSGRTGGQVRSGGGRPGATFSQRGSINDFLVGPQAGINTTKAFGLNFSNTWNQKLDLTGSYFYNQTNNITDQSLLQEYFIPGDSNQFYQEHNLVDSKNINHRVNIRAEYKFDRFNSLVFTPRLSFQSYKSFSFLKGMNFISSGEEINELTDNYQSQNSGFNINSNLLYRHAFARRGRTFSIDLRTETNSKDGKTSLKAVNKYPEESTVNNDSIDQRSNEEANGYLLTANMVYTEPIGKKNLLQLSFNRAYTNSFSDKKTYNLNSIVYDYTALDTALTNNFDNDYFTNKFETGIRHRSNDLTLSLGVAFQVASLQGNQSFPVINNTKKQFFNVLPTAMMRYKLNEKSSIRMFYRTQTKAPSMGQLQNVVDNSNPLLLTVGNPDLKQEVSKTLITRYSWNNLEKSRNMFVFFYLKNTSDFISNSTVIAGRDTVDFEGITLNPGSQLSYPVNLSGYWNMRSFFTYGLPVDLLKSNLNFNTGFGYTRTPGSINEILNISNSYNFSQGVVLGSNISEHVDFTVSYNGNYNIVKNSVQLEIDDSYYYHLLGIKFNWIFWKGLVLNNQVVHNFYQGLVGSFNQDYLLWNISFGKKVFANQRGEIKLTVYDLLDQNRNISRTITDSYIQDQETETLSQYFMVSFTYHIRNFKEARNDRM